MTSGWRNRVLQIVDDFATTTQAATADLTEPRFGSRSEA